MTQMLARQKPKAPPTAAFKSTKTLLQCLAVLGNIQPFQLLLLRNPERHEGADRLEQDESDPAGPGQRDRDAVELQQQLLRIALDQAGGTADRGGGEHA